MPHDDERPLLRRFASTSKGGSCTPGLRRVASLLLVALMGTLGVTAAPASDEEQSAAVTNNGLPSGSPTADSTPPFVDPTQAPTATLARIFHGAAVRGGDRRFAAV